MKLSKKPTPPPEAPDDEVSQAPKDSDKPIEINGPKGPDPTRYGDWERKGIASDF